MRTRRFLGAAWLATLLGALAGVGCATAQQHYPLQPAAPHRYMIDQRNYTFAVYDSTNQLITHPIEDLRWRLRQADEGITDVYIIAHGWNYTVPEAIANYYRYIDMVDRDLDPTLARELRPYFIFVVWPSVMRPVREAARSLLPFQLDRVIAPLTSKADDYIFRLPTTWKQSLDAYSVALGERTPDSYWLQAYDQVQPVAAVGSVEIGRDLPVSLLIHELIRMRGDAYFGAPSYRIHLVGHSYGAKLVALSGIEVLRRVAFEAGWDPRERVPQDLIESMVLISPAFHPRELAYVKSFAGSTGLPELVSREEIESALRSIPRKAVVYSRFDHANGPLFAASQLLLNNQRLQTSHATMNSLTGQLDRSGGMVRHANLLVRPLGGVAQVAWNLGTAPLQAGAGTLFHLVPDFLHHVRENDTFDRPGSDGTGVVRAGLNAVHYFVPLDELLDLRAPSARRGFFRLTAPALGATGLSQLATGRPDLGGRHPGLDSFDNLGPLDGLAPADAERDAAEFVELARSAGATGPESPLRRDVILSFDASRIYSSWSLPKGSHSDLGSHEQVDVGDGPTEKRRYTYNFVFNFTLCLPTESSAARPFCRTRPGPEHPGASEIVAAN